MNHLGSVWIFETIIKLMFTLSFIIFPHVGASDYDVGGVTGWDLTSDLQNWKPSNTLYTGDNLVFVYGSSHNVLEVDQGGYAVCNTSNPIATYSGGDTVIALDTVGTRYFICGTPGHCALGLKLLVDVLQPPDNSTSSEPNRRGGGKGGNKGKGGNNGKGGNKTPPSPKPLPPPPPKSNTTRAPPPPPDSIEIPDVPISPTAHKGSAIKLIHDKFILLSQVLILIMIFHG